MIPVYLAPMEGLTDHRFRRIHHAFFPGISKYFTPFITINHAGHIRNRELRDILPENNTGIPLVPQILTGRSDLLLRGAALLLEKGYREINLNLGCPSATVTAKGKGSGFLQDPEGLERFLEETIPALEKMDIRLSIKTRIGFSSPEEALPLMELYSRYPLSELIIHPRTREEFYSGVPHREIYGAMLQKAPFPVVYNGNIFESSDGAEILRHFPSTAAIMTGRGIIRNPALGRDLCCTDSGEMLPGHSTTLTVKEFRDFHDALLECCGSDMDLRALLFRMKEFWGFWSALFPEREKELKAVRKSTDLPHYRTAVQQLLRNTENF